MDSWYGLGVKLKNMMDSNLNETQKQTTPAVAEAAMPMDHWTTAALLERAVPLHKLAEQKGGSAGETLRKFPRHSAILSFRCGDGEAEIHENFADVFFMLDGETTLVTGGRIVGSTNTAPGEIRGTAVEGGRGQELKAGDVAHVPAGLPHQMLVAEGKTVTCMVMKVQEKS
jgi:mannose-6-phosphate isomerase-like protein (cupin superfamily)